MIAFKPARRKRAKLFACFTGVSNSGKTFSALLTARGLVGDKGRIAMIDTQHGQGEMYEHLTAYDVAQLGPPFTPKRFVEMIDAAESNGYDAVIIDSLSHEWAGEGGILDMHATAAAAPKANAYTAWGIVTPQHDKLVKRLMSADLHVLVTMRSKTAYTIGEDEKGRKTVDKVGLKPIQREGLEYEFTVSFEMSPEMNVARASKDVTGIFKGKAFIPSLDTGRELAAWLGAVVTLEDLEAEISRLGLDKGRVETWTRKAWQKELGGLDPADRDRLISKLPEFAKAAKAEKTEDSEEIPPEAEPSLEAPLPQSGEPVVATLDPRAAVVVDELCDDELSKMDLE